MLGSVFPKSMMDFTNSKRLEVLAMLILTDLLDF
jgi:hypothetical protein